MPDESVLHIGVSDDLTEPDGSGLADAAIRQKLSTLPHVAVSRMHAADDQWSSRQLRDCDAVITLRPRISAESLDGVTRLAVIARWGVGYNMIDVEACTEHDVLIAITPLAVRRPVAEGALTLLLAVTHHVRMKDILVRSGRWHDKTRYPGVGLQGRTLGILGLGNTGCELARLVHPFGLAEILACDPYASVQTAATLGAHLVELDDMLARCDFLCITCPLTEATTHLLAARRLSLMKPTAFLVNVSRGPIINEPDLIDALQRGRIAGAGLDVFEQEPLPADSPLTKLDNVILAPHAICWTDALVRDNGLHACEYALTVLRGDVPPHVVNPQVTQRPGFRRKLESLRRRWSNAHVA